MKRIKRRIRMWLRRMFDPKHSTKITTEERYLMIIISQLMKRKDSELLTIPYVTKCYIKSDNAKIFITVSNLGIVAPLSIRAITGWLTPLSCSSSL